MSDPSTGTPAQRPSPDLGFVGQPRAAVPERRSPWRWLVALVAVALVVAAVIAARRSDELLGVAPRLAVSSEGRLAILPWVNATGERSQDWVRVGLSALVSQVLDDLPTVETVPAAALRSALDARGLDVAEAGARPAAIELARAHGAGRVLETEVFREDDGYRIAATLWGEGDTRARASFEGPALLPLAERLADAVSRGIDQNALRVAFARSLSSNDVFNQLYAMGLSEMSTAGAAAARPYFEILLRHQPRFLLAQARLAECDRSEGQVEASRKARILLLEESQRRGDQPLQARSLAALADIAASAGRFEEADELAQQAHAIFVAQRDRAGQLASLARRARLALAGRQGARAEAYFVEMINMQQALGDRVGEADSLRHLGALQLDAGDLDGAVVTLEQARERARQLGDRDGEMETVARLGSVSYRRGDLEGADASWAEALDHHRSRGHQRPTLVLLEQRAKLALERRDLDAAEDFFGDQRALAAELGEAAAEGRAALALADMLLRRGYGHQARPHLDRALALDREIGDPLALQLVIARFAHAQGEWALAAATLEAAKAQAGPRWTEDDEALLAAARRAGVRGRP